MKRLLLLTVFASVLLPLKAFADFGDADFPVGTFDDGPKSYHDAWCRKIKNECRVRFDGPVMSVEGQGGITSNQFITFRVDRDGGEYYIYLTYRKKNGSKQIALFLFANQQASMDFVRALVTWRRQEVDMRPNYRLPASQGPQETHGRDNGQNPYD
jgi:hypothetical protein